MEYGVGVGENLPGGYAVLSGPRLEVVGPLPLVVPVDAVDAPPGDVAHPRSVLGVAVEGDALGITRQMKVGYFIYSQSVEIFSVNAEANQLVLLPFSVREYLGHLVPAVRNYRRVITMLDDKGPVYSRTIFETQRPVGFLLPNGSLTHLSFNRLCDPISS